MNLIFWMKEINYHWIDTLKAIQPLINGEITIVSQEDISTERKAIGWNAREEKEYKIIKLCRSDWKTESAKIINENSEAIHFFQGFVGGWCSRKFLPLILQLLRKRGKIVFIVEHYSTSYTGYHRDEPLIVSWLRVRLRPFLYKLTAKLIKQNIKNHNLCILALSQLAQTQMEKSGFDKSIIFPFGYFIKKEYGITIHRSKFVEPINSVFVGSLINRKGIDLLCKALSEINRNGIRFKVDIYGPGEYRPYNKTTGVDYITYKGILPQKKVQETIAGYDLLVLPSRHDGWGVVVNEALLQGIPVVVSDQTGASSLILASKSGLVFRSEDHKDLQNTLMRLLNEKPLLSDLQKNAKKISAIITPGIAADHLYKILIFCFFPLDTNSRPESIWY